MSNLNDDLMSMEVEMADHSGNRKRSAESIWEVNDLKASLENEVPATLSVPNKNNPKILLFFLAALLIKIEC